MYAASDQRKKICGIMGIWCKYARSMQQLSSKYHWKRHATSLFVCLLWQDLMAKLADKNLTSWTKGINVKMRPRLPMVFSCAIWDAITVAFVVLQYMMSRDVKRCDVLWWMKNWILWRSNMWVRVSVDLLVECLTSKKNEATSWTSCNDNNLDSCWRNDCTLSGFPFGQGS